MKLAVNRLLSGCSFVSLGLLGISAGSLTAFVLSVGTASAVVDDQYLIRGPLGGKPNIVESAEQVGFNFNPESGIYTAFLADYPLDNLVQFPIANVIAGASSNDGSLRRQVGAAAGDFDGDGRDEVIFVYETNYRDGVSTLYHEKALEIVFLRGDTGMNANLEVISSIQIPAFILQNGGHELFRPPRVDLDPPSGTVSFDRNLRVTAGQLDDDPEEEAIVAWWTADETIQLAVFSLVGDSIEVVGLDFAFQRPMVEDDLTLRIGVSTGKVSATFALAVGDYDGDLVDEIALVYPGVNESAFSPDIDGFRTANVAIYEFTGTSSTSLFVEDAMQAGVGFTAGGSSTDGINNDIGLIDSGGGSFKVPFPGFPGSLTGGSDGPDGMAVWLKRLVATAANLPYEPIRPSKDRKIDRVGAPRHSLVVGFSIQQENINEDAKWKLPTGLVWLRPSRFAEECTSPTNGDTTYCLTNSDPVLNHTRGGLDGYNDDGRTRASNFCLAAADIRGADVEGATEDGRDEIVMMMDPFLIVLQAIDDGATHTSSSFPNLVNANPTPTCADGNLPNDGTNETETNGECLRIFAAASTNRRDSGGRGSQCSVHVVDVNGHQTSGALLAPEIMLNLLQSDEGNLDQRTREVSIDTLTVNPQHTTKLYDGEAGLRPAVTVFPDIDGDSVRLGPPIRHITVSGVDQPLVILSAPPIHFDVCPDDEPQCGCPEGLLECDDPSEAGILDPLDCYPDFQSGCPYTAVYQTEAGSEKAVSHNYSADWQVANETTGCFGTACTTGLGGKVEVSLSTSYGEQFSSTQSSGNTLFSAESRAVGAGKDLALIQRGNDYEIWEYPILCDTFNGVECDADDTVAVVSPTTTTTGPADGLTFGTWPPRLEESDTRRYLMTHEAGNLISYKSNFEMEQFLLDDLVYFVATQYEMSPSSNVPFITLNTRNFTSDERSKGSIFSFMSSVSASGSIGIVDVATTFSGEYSQTDLVSKSTVISSGQSIQVMTGQTPIGTEEHSFNVTTYVYLRNGAFVLDYAVDGDICPGLDPECVLRDLVDGDPNDGENNESFFVQYASLPDPSFRLPMLRDVERNQGNNVNDAIRRTTEILVERVPIEGDPNPLLIEPGVIVNLRTRVHNYSLVNLETPVTVTFYDGDPDEGGKPIGLPAVIQAGTDACPDGTAVICARGTIDIPNPVVWTIPPMMSEVEFNSVRVFAELDIEGDPEIHIDNNLAWRPLSADFKFVPEPSAGLAGAAALCSLFLITRARCRRQRGRTE